MIPEAEAMCESLSKINEVCICEGRMSEKLCINCKHLMPDILFRKMRVTFWLTKKYEDTPEMFRYGKCAMTGETEMVTGATKHDTASVARLVNTMCGQDGKWFEAKT